jgi:UPF0716 protein FxsA
MPILFILLCFLSLVYLEFSILVKLSTTLGILPTLAIVFGAGIVGAWIAKWQGLRALFRVQDQLQQGVVPTRTLGDGALILVAAFLLVLPGVVSDILGITLLIPPVRKMVLAGFRHWFANHVHVQSSTQWHTNSGSFPGEHPRRGHSTVVEGRVIEAHVVDEEK